MSQACPTCKRPWHKKGRWCASCAKPIKKKHKWHIDGCMVRHDDCSNPEMKVPEQPLFDQQGEGNACED